MRQILFLYTNNHFHRAMCKVCTQSIHLFRGLNEREFSKLSCEFCFFFCRQSPPLLSYNCFYAPRSIIWNHYYRVHYSDYPLMIAIMIVGIGNHTHLSPIRKIIVLAIIKIGRGEAESYFEDCVYNYSLIGRECV